MARVFHGPTGHAPRHLPFRRAALSFIRWQARRGVLNPLDASPPGSLWWRAVNEQLLRDGWETVGLLRGLVGEPSSSGSPASAFWGAVLLLLIVPPFALLGLAVVALAALAALVALAGAVLAAPYLIVRNVRRRFAQRHQSTQGSVQVAPVISQ